MSPRALLFDVFGTCVDWYGGVSRAVAAAFAADGLVADAASFTLAWRRAYFDGMAEVRAGRAPWRRIDSIHRDALDALIAENRLDALSAGDRERLARAWHALDPWPDVGEGLARVRAHRWVATLSNGNLDLLIDLARHGGLAWDALFCSDLFGCFKPDPRTYLGACRLMGLEPGQVMMVACHRSDLDAAARSGLRTVFVARPMEYGAKTQADCANEGEFDLVVAGFTELAARLETMQ